MQTSVIDREVKPELASGDKSDRGASGVSWGAVFAGAAGAAALSYILVILGFGLGLSSVSPWTNEGANAATIGVATILWLTFTQIAASGMGGYLAGRLRVKWAGVHTDEVYFRDTAHGFLSWAVASLVVAAFLASAMASIVAGGASTAGAIIKGAASTAGAAASQIADSSGDSSGYFVDKLFRADPSMPGPSGSTTPSDHGSKAEAARIFLNDLSTGTLSPEDKTYLAQVVARETGIAQPQAEQRIDAAFGQLKSTIESATQKAKTAADEARKTTAHAALWTFISLLAGAFFASLAATFGGRRRDANDVVTARPLPR